MNVLFLDVDGVLNSHKYLTSLYEKKKKRLEQEDFFDPKCMVVLKKIVSKFNLKIVITSSWKIADMQTIERVFKKYDLGILDKTKNYGDKRGKEIREWLSNHSKVKNFVILDDDFFSDYVGLEKNLVQTSFSSNGGLNDSHILLVEKIITRDKLDI